MPAVEEPRERRRRADAGDDAPVALLDRFGRDAAEPLDPGGGGGDVRSLGARRRDEQEGGGPALRPFLDGPLHPGDLADAEEDGDAPGGLPARRKEPRDGGRAAGRRQERRRPDPSGRGSFLSAAL